MMRAQHHRRPERGSERGASGPKRHRRPEPFDGAQDLAKSKGTPPLLFAFFALLASPAFAAGPLSLDAALGTAHQNQPQLRQAAATTSAANARVDEAKAPLLPQLSFTVTVTHCGELLPFVYV